MILEEKERILKVSRLIGKYTSGQNGPLFIIIAGIHGNEPAGVLALQSVFEKLEESQPEFKGMFVGVAGNLTALEKQTRFIDKDLNRQWTSDKVSNIRSSSTNELATIEDREQKELINFFEDIINKSEHKTIVMMDLHTTSSEGGSFTLALSDEVSRRIAHSLGQPVVNGLENVIEGTTLNFFADSQYSGIGFEAGQHTDPETVHRMEAGIWMSIESLGQLESLDPELKEKCLALLEPEKKNLPKEVNFVYRHAITPEDNFRMKPGYTNFQVIRKGESLATDKRGEITAKEDGLILMPLYQKKGEDGFFIVHQ